MQLKGTSPSSLEKRSDGVTMLSDDGLVGKWVGMMRRRKMKEELNCKETKRQRPEFLLRGGGANVEKWEK